MQILSIYHQRKRERYSNNEKKSGKMETGKMENQDREKVYLGIGEEVSLERQMKRQMIT